MSELLDVMETTETKRLKRYKRTNSKLSIAGWLLYMYILIPIIWMLETTYERPYHWYVWAAAIVSVSLVSLSINFITDTIKELLRFRKEYWDDKARQARWKENHPTNS